MRKKFYRILLLIVILSVTLLYIILADIRLPIGSNDMVIAIDAGHGWDTPGKRTPPLPFDIDLNKDGVIDFKEGERIKEHLANVGVASRLSKELKRCGFKVVKVGFKDENYEDNVDLPLKDRHKRIKKSKSSLSVSIHFNAFGDGETYNSANGIEIYTHDQYMGDSEELAQKVLAYMKEGRQEGKAKILSADFAMTNTQKMNTNASILVECAYMTNLYEMEYLMANEDFWMETAIQIAKGICEYKGVTYIEE